MASDNPTEEVEDTYENQDLEEEPTETGEEIFENQYLEDQTTNTEFQIPGSDDVLDKRKKEINRKKNQKNKHLIPDKTDPNKVLIDNLKDLGLYKLMKTKMLKETKTRKAFKRIMSRPTTKIPCPVPLMSTDQLIEWIYPEISKDFVEQGLAPKLKVPWGNPKYHPRFWPDELWPWHLVSNFRHPQKHNRPHNVSLVDTLKAAVSKRLRHLNIDPESFISEDYTEEEDIKKRKVRGLKEVGRLYN